jgi:hypothetical protein
MHTLAEEKLKATSAESETSTERGKRTHKRAGGQIQPLPIRYHMWLYQSWYVMTCPARMA